MNTPTPEYNTPEEDRTAIPQTRQERRALKSAQRKRRRHLAAAITGYLVWAGLAVLVGINLYNLAATLRGYGPGASSNPPLGRGDGVTRMHLLVDEQSGRNFMGDGGTCQVWRLSGDKDRLREKVKNEIWNNLVWFHRPFDDRDRKALQFVSSWPEYAKAAPFAGEVKTGDFYFAYEHLRIYEDGRVGDAGIWLFSPDKMLLVYLNANM